MFIGIETPVPESLREAQKYQNTHGDLVEMVKTVQRSGMEVMGGFIVGFDNDPQEIFQLQYDFIQKTGIAAAMVGLLTALPKTQLYHRLLGEGRLDTKSTRQQHRGRAQLHSEARPRVPDQRLQAADVDAVRAVNLLPARADVSQRVRPARPEAEAYIRRHLRLLPHRCG